MISLICSGAPLKKYTAGGCALIIEKVPLLDIPIVTRVPNDRVGSAGRYRSVPQETDKEKYTP